MRAGGHMVRAEVHASSCRWMHSARAQAHIVGASAAGRWMTYKKKLRNLKRYCLLVIYVQRLRRSFPNAASYGKNALLSLQTLVPTRFYALKLPNALQKPLNECILGRLYGIRLLIVSTFTPNFVHVGQSVGDPTYNYKVKMKQLSRTSMREICKRFL